MNGFADWIRLFVLDDHFDEQSFILCREKFQKGQRIHIKRRTPSYGHANSLKLKVKKRACRYHVLLREQFVKIPERLNGLRLLLNFIEKDKRFASYDLFAK